MLSLIRSQRQEIQAEKARFLPVITANYTLQWSAAEPDSPHFLRIVRFQTIGRRFSMPLFNGWERMSNLQRVQISKRFNASAITSAGECIASSTKHYRASL